MYDKTNVKELTLGSQLELAKTFTEKINLIAEFEEEVYFGELDLLDTLASLGFQLIASDKGIEDDVLSELVEMMKSGYFDVSKKYSAEEKSAGLSGNLETAIDMTCHFTRISIVRNKFSNTSSKAYISEMPKPNNEDE
jgi:hypothetical protein